MLQIIRSTAGSWVVKILFVALIISFAVWGIGDVTKGVQKGVAQVGDQAITPLELDQAYRVEFNRMRQMVGPEFSEEQARQFGLRDRALEQLIQKKLLALAADDLGLRVADDTVRAEVLKVPAFKDSFGNFDANLMRALLQQNGLTEAGFVEDVRGDMARSDLIGAVTAGANASKTLAEALYRYRFEGRTFEIVTIPYNAMPAAPSPDQATLEAFHKEKAVRYTAPEYRTLNVALIEAVNLTKDVEVTDELLKEYYDGHAGDYITPEKRSITQAVFPSKDAADKALAEVKGGKSVEDVATAAGVEAVTLEDVLKDGLPVELAEPAFATAQGTSGGPVESAFGFHIFTITKVQAGGERKLEDVKDEVAAKVRQDKAVEKMFELSTKLEDELAGGTPLAEAAQAVGARVVKLEKIDNRGADKAGVAQGATLPAIDKIVTAGFTVAEGQTGSVEEAGSEAFFAVQVESVIPAALKPLDEVKSVVLGDWQAEQKQVAARKKAEEIVEKIKAGSAAKDAAAGVSGALVQNVDPLMRAGAPSALIPAAAVQTLFGSAVGSVTTAEKPTGVVVAKLTGIIAADPANPMAANQLAQLASSTGQAMQDELVMQYLAALRAHYGVTINQSLINQLYRTTQE
ncbi:peptidylprolyl isomerase [Niveispirillum sp.]|uniref:peptidylprolyl isomerase n=1 Tax=Niveispirillum sp. TaxID=1917217 RepID=UPI001B45C35E|nr:peptidylprolyl isomerase [Niveispirillum sp.]MBP7337329.1 SurA N-terminal domain-containing protein [Niveispirillum sp.]